MKAGTRRGRTGCPRFFRRAGSVASVLAAAWLIAFAAAGCRGKTAETSHDGAAMSESSEPTIQSVLEKESPRLMAMPGVVAVGEGRTKDGKPCVRVYVEGLTPERRAAFPKALGPYPVEVEDSGGPVRAMPDSAAPR